MSYTPKILIVDDESRMCESMKILLSNHPYEIHTANNVRCSRIFSKRNDWNEYSSDFK
jgi:DNA-binding NtrC family response regulator